MTSWVEKEVKEERQKKGFSYLECTFVLLGMRCIIVWRCGWGFWEEVVAWSSSPFISGRILFFAGSLAAARLLLLARST